MYTDILRRFLILEMFVVVTLCCNCIKRTPMQNLKRHEYALYIKSRGYVYEIPGVEFRVSVIKTYKGDTWKLFINHSNHIHVRMPKYCHIYLRKGEYYLIFGKYKGQALIETDACAGDMEWKNTTEEFRTILVYYYLRNP